MKSFIFKFFCETIEKRMKKIKIKNFFLLVIEFFLDVDSVKREKKLLLNLIGRRHYEHTERGRYKGWRH